MHSKIDPKIIEHAIKFVKERKKLDDIQQYRETYYALLDLGKTVRQDPSSLKLLQLGLAAYGWMPTIFDNLPDEKKLKDFSELVKACEEDQSRPNNFVSLLKTFNNSVVGTSKVLHFLFPNIFPIWDSNIAFAFGYNPAYTASYNNPETYIKYMDGLAAFFKRKKQFQAPQVIKTHFQKSAVTPLRELELCLFLYGKSELEKQKKGKRPVLAALR